MSRPVCPRCGKIRYPTWGKAVRAALRGVVDEAFRPYPCPKPGGGWHLTSHPGSRRPRRAA